jgi:hypothetical protein
VGVLGVLDDVEWGGDFVFGVVLVGLALAVVAFGFGWGRWRALAVLAAVWTVPLVLSDALYFGSGANPFGFYCGEPKCDPGPLPATLIIFWLPGALVLSGAGIALRKRRRRRTQQAARARRHHRRPPPS